MKFRFQGYGLPFWQIPQILFLIMGIVTISSILISYALGTRYIEDPLLVALLVIFISAILLIISAVITRSFERLLEANKMKSEFIGIVSHQLRSPLSNLKWVIELLLSDGIKTASKKQLEYFKILEENNKRMEILVSGLLTVARIEQGRNPLKKQKISLKKIIEKAINDTAIFSRANNLKIEFVDKTGSFQVLIDPSQIELVIENLLDNAIRYSRNKGKIEVKLEKRDNVLRFEIKDAGVGIPEDEQKYIFQKFFRSNNAAKHQTEGSGLGLYIAKSIIEKSGGKIGFKSQEGIGSTFWFNLPI